MVARGASRGKRVARAVVVVEALELGIRGTELDQAGQRQLEMAADLRVDRAVGILADELRRQPARPAHQVLIARRIRDSASVGALCGRLDVRHLSSPRPAVSTRYSRFRAASRQPPQPSPAGFRKSPPRIDGWARSYCFG